MGQQVGEEEEEEQRPLFPWDFAIEAINPACPIIGLCPLFARSSSQHPLDEHIPPPKWHSHHDRETIVPVV